ncbi:MAG: DUF2207 domain-containing protein [bacterium]|nr:DUF2207 domain-containing protein [bacterium]
MRSFFIGIVFCFIGVVTPWSAHAESIENYEVILRVNTNGTLNVSEGIHYDFGTLEKHGILRKIPLVNQDGPRIHIKTVSINDENRNTYHYTEKESGDILEYKIGGSNTTLTGRKTYWLNYDVSNVIRPFKDHDELYWNAIGTEWSVPIAHATVRIEIPEEIPTVSATAYCYTGASGSDTKDCSITTEDHAFIITANRSLYHGEGLTVAVALPVEGIQGLATMSRVEKIERFSQKYFPIVIAVSVVIFAPLLFFIILLLQRKKWVSSIIIPKELKNKPVIPEYGPPEGLTPFDVSILSDRTFDMQDIGPVIIDLAIKGYLKIRYLDGEGWLKKRDYEFIKLKDGNDLEHFAYKEVFALLFKIAGPDSVTHDSIKLSELKNREGKASALALILQKKSSQHLEREGYVIWDRSRNTILIVSGIGSFLVIVGIYISFIALPLIIVGAVLIFISTKMKVLKLTQKGIDTIYHLLCFKEFLAMTESEKYKLINAPELKPELFEKFLPYAMAFGIEKKWAEKFSTITLSQLAWVDTGMMPGHIVAASAFSSSDLTDSLRSLTSDFKSAFISNDSSFSSGGGGGGSSGGGSGGGGGGSW